MRNACGSPRLCVECDLQERAQRIQRWREAGTPEVGIFYVIDGALWLESMPVPEVKPLREVIIYAGKHRSYWHNLRRMIRTLEGVPHTCYPRGRVVYVQAAARYDLYLGPEILTSEPLIRHVMDEMHLPATQTEVRLALHFLTRSFL
ncbi:MAG TPA: hypothetical protein VGC99_23920 [Candidatus Tectomicrobia bacterium]